METVWLVLGFSLALHLVSGFALVQLTHNYQAALKAIARLQEALKVMANAERDEWSEWDEWLT